MITAETRGRLQLHSEVRFERKKGNYRPNQRSLVSAFLMRRGLALETLASYQTWQFLWQVKFIGNDLFRLDFGNSGELED